MKVSNLKSSNGNKVANQFILEDDAANDFFQSYDSIIVKREYESGKIFLDERYWDYSRTTSKYRNIFLHEDTAATKDKIKSGEYILTNLNWLIL